MTAAPYRRLANGYYIQSAVDYSIEDPIMKGVRLAYQPELNPTK